VRLPLFPLATVLFPGTPIPLHVFEPRYREMFAELLRGERRFGVVAVTRGREVGPSSSYQPVGCVAEVERVRPYPDGRLDVTARGGGRFQVEQLVQRDPYLVAEVALLPEELGERAPQRARVAAALFTSYLRVLASLAGERREAVTVPRDPVAASYLLAAALQVDLDDKQRLLDLPSAAERLSAEIRLLRRELALLERARRTGPAPMAGPFSLN
jgi:Lon protease-like protein